MPKKRSIKEVQSQDSRKEDSAGSSKEKEELLKEIQDLREDKERLQNINDKLKKRKKQLQKKINKLGEKNRDLLDRLQEKDETRSGEEIVLPSNSEIKGDIKSEKKIKVEKQALIQGSLESKDDIIIGHKNCIKGDVISDGGEVKIGNSTEVDGVIKGETVHLAEGVCSGAITAKGKVVIDKNCELSDIYAIGDLNLGKNVDITGDVKYASKINAEKGVSVMGSLEAKEEEELHEEMENLDFETPPMFPIFLHNSEEYRSEEKEEKSEFRQAEEESAAESVEWVRELLRMARDEEIDISEEKDMVKEGVSYYKEEAYEESQKILDRCKERLEEKLETISKEEPDEQAEEQRSDEGSETSFTREDVVDSFLEIKEVGRSTAERLYEGGFHTIEELKEASQEELSEVKGIGKNRSKKIKENI